MGQLVRYQLWIAAAAGVIFFTNLGGPALFDMDEALYATCAREMLERRDPIEPRFNGAMFPEKPPLMFWTMMAGFEIFGTGEWAEWGARFFSAVMGVGTALAAFHLGRILFNARVGLWAGLITASTIIFTFSAARAATVDSALTFVTTLAFLLFAIGWKKAKGSGFRGQGSGEEVDSGQWAVSGKSEIQNPSSLIPHPSSGPDPRPLTPDPRPLNPDPRSLNPWYAAGMYALIGLAVLAKGPVGMLLPLAAMGVFLLVTDGWRPKKGTAPICAEHPKGRSGGHRPKVGRGLSPFSAWRNLLRSAWWMRPFTALLVIAAVAAPWYVLVGIETHGEWLRKFFIDFNLRPFKQPILSHGDVSSFGRATAIFVSILYYFYQIPAVLCGFFPWAVFLGPTLVNTIRGIRAGKGSEVRGQGSGAGDQCTEVNDRHDASLSPLPSPLTPLPSRAGLLLASCWFGTWFVFWSICKTKLPHYLLPAYPALALLTACFIDRWMADPAGLPHWCLRNAWISTILVGIGMTIALPIVAAIFLRGEPWLGLIEFALIGLILVVGGGWCWREAACNRHQRAVIGFTVMSVAFLTATFGFAPLRVDKFQNARPMIAAIRADWAKKEDSQMGTVPFSSPPIATYQFFRWSTVFYAGHPVTRCESDESTGRSARSELAQFVAESRCSYVITTDECEREIHKEFPGKFQRIFHQPRFLGPGEMVVLRFQEGAGATQ